MKIVTAEQMAGLERESERTGVSTDTLMENAGLAVAQSSRRLMGGAAGKRVLVLVGPGNNGADGLVSARHLARWGAEVTAYLVTGRPGSDPKMDLALEYGVTVTAVDQTLGWSGLDRMITRSHLVIDAILGTGRSRPLSGAIKDVVSRLSACGNNTHRPPVLAMDLPTGLNADTGEVDPACPHCDVTVSLGFPKVGLVTFPGAERVGRLEVADIGLPAGLDGEQQINLELLTAEWVRDNLPARPLNSHKGTFGHALVVAGSRHYVGAAFLAAQASVRVGAGLTTLASPHGVYSIAAGKLAEVIHLPLPEDGEGRIHPDAAALIQGSSSRYSAMLVGCGLGWSDGTRDFLERLLTADLGPSMPIVVDADGLNNLSQIPNWWRHLRGPAVVTPHPGEMATLTETSLVEVQQDRIAAARQWASCWNTTVALKGAGTVIAEPGGRVRISSFANPGLASGGTGDVLTGIIAGFMAQGLSPAQAAGCGVYIHGRAAEAVRERKGDAGTIASDLIEYLPETIKATRGHR